MEHGYKTLRHAGSDSFTVKKSRFIGHGSPARTEKEALDFLRQIREKHKDASHNCWAYIIGRNAGIMRYSDDGEPGGTAGLPIIEVIRARQAVDCCVVVTRYFGGVLLGAGGLTRAYAQGAKAALDAGQIITMEDSVRLRAGVEYPLWGRVEHALKALPVRGEGAEFGAAVTAAFIVRSRDRARVEEELTRVTDGRVEIAEAETVCYGWED
ncbi:MAG: IMPACT family protein [Firmicutes bacterium]|nr:IMPACT family protein [Bacillota bacterium]